MRCIKGALEYAIVMRFTHVSTAHYTYSWFLLSYASRTKCKVLWLSYVWTNPLTMILTVLPLTLLRRICYTHAVAPVILYPVILSLLCYTIWILLLHVIGYGFIPDYWDSIRVVLDQV